MKSAEEEVLRNHEKLAVQAEFREKTDIGSQFAADQTRPAHDGSADNPKVRMAQPGFLYHLDKPGTWRGFLEVEVVFVVFDDATGLVRQPRFGIAEDDIRLPIQNGHALFYDRGIPEIVCGRPLMVLPAA